MLFMEAMSFLFCSRKYYFESRQTNNDFPLTGIYLHANFLYDR